MASDSNKKLLILYILDCLKEESDFEHQLTQVSIIKYISKKWGMECERKAVARNIEFLIDYGYDIVKGNRGYYLAEREFDSSEITYLVDSVFSSRSIPAKNAQSIVKKLAGFSSKYERKAYKHLYKPNDESIGNKQFFFSIDVISRAIDMKKKLKFNYVSFRRENGEIKTVSKEHIVSPYFMVNSRGKYYLVCNKVDKQSLSNYKIENIVDVFMLDEDVDDIRKLDGYQNGIDEVKYINEHIYMFGGSIVNSHIKLLTDRAVSSVYEWFGQNTRIIYSSGEYYALVKSDEQALCYWALQYGEQIEILKPESLVGLIKSTISLLNQVYKLK
jgi:predicted DNA-binding transcriptional regulator YafY